MEEEANRMTEAELDRLLVEMILKMSPKQLAKAAAIVYGERAKEEEGDREIVA